MGYQDLLLQIPGILTSQLTITDPITSSLATARIMGNNSPTIGSVGFSPPVTGQPFAIIIPMHTKEDMEKEPNRIWTWNFLDIFIAVQHADTASQFFDYDGVAQGYIDSMRQVVAANRRLLPASQSLYPTAGDVRWEMYSSKIEEKLIYFGVPWYGSLCKTRVLVINSVQYQF